MPNVLFAWVDRVSRFLENRPHEFIRVAFFALFVSATRASLEILLGGFQVSAPLLLLAGNFAFYLMSFYAFAVALKIALPGVPWRKSSNAILIGLFLGLFPPLIDAFVFGLGNREHYAFMAKFPSYPIFFWDPQQHINVGEATAIWLSILFCGIYVYVRSRRIGSAVLGLALAYVVVLWGGALGATLVRRFLVNQLNATLQVFVSEPLMLAQVHLLQILMAYLVLQPALARGLARRLPHTLPFVVAVFLGAAFEGRIGYATWWYAALVWYVSIVALAQNDFYDSLEEGARRYLDREDLHLLNGLALFAIVILFTRNSAMSFLVLLQFVAAVIYNYPFYRARNFFPANLKIEGLWGVTSFLIGWLSAQEMSAAAQQSVLPEALSLSTLDTTAALAAFLIFGGFSLLSALKDQKDVVLDAQSNTQTLYTLAARKNRLVLVHGLLLGFSAAAFVAMPVLLVWAGRLSVNWILSGLAAAIGLAVADARPSRPGFYRALTIISVYLALLTYGIARQSP